MDLSSILGGLVLLLIGITPFALMHFNRSRKAQKMLKSLADLAAINNGSISNHDLWNNAAIGMDDSARIVYYTKKNGDIWMAKQIHLADIQNCRVVNSSSMVSTPNGQVPVIERLALAFVSKTGNRKGDFA